MQPSKRGWLLVLLLSLVSFMAYFLRTSITVAQEQMVPEIGLSFGQMGLITGVGFQLAYALGQIPAGIAGDWYGARRVLGWALVLFAVATFLTGVVPAAAGAAAAFSFLLAARALLGTAQAATYPVGSMAIAHTLPPGQQATANAIYIGSANLATALVPLTLAPLMVVAGWRAVFMAGGVLALILALVWYRWAPDARPAGPPPALRTQLAHPARAAARPGHFPGLPELPAAFGGLLRVRVLVLSLPHRRTRHDDPRERRVREHTVVHGLHRGADVRMAGGPRRHPEGRLPGHGGAWPWVAC